MTTNIEKEPLLLVKKRDSVHEDEFSTTTCPSFTTLFSKSFMRLPQLTKASQTTTDDTDSEMESDYETDLPDLPYVTNPVLLEVSNISAGEKLRQLRLLMKEHGIGVYIIPSEDEHQSEYTAKADMRREYISGFTGSAGLCVVTLHDDKKLTGKAALSTDGRYFLQAEKQLDPNHWTLLKQGIASYPTWKQFAIREAIESKFSNVIACDPRLISVSTGEYFEKIRILQYLNKFRFILLQVNLVDEVWGKDKPTRSLDPVYVLPLKYSGETTESKLDRIRNILRSHNNTHLVVSALDEVAWLLNLRADSDIPFSPVFFSYVIVTLESVILYIHKIKIDNGTAELHLHLSNIKGLTIKPYSDFYSDLSQLKATISQSDLLIVLPDKSATNYALYSYIPQSLAKRTVKFESIISNLKIKKNTSELFNAKVAQFKDSLAFILLISWLEYQIINKNRKISEYEAACKIYSIRSKLPNFKGLSYETISSSGSNAAIIHYAPTKEENSIIDPRQVYLLDSGAHYLEGTTDITRTILFEGLKDKALEEKYKKYYTLVLKGHLAVAMAKFPPNSSNTGTILDAYSRQALWNEGLDFNHGTGHGVGSFGNVHEGPLYILTTSGGANSSDLFKKGGILTDEPGYYVDGECGFRIESELEITNASEKFGKTRNGDSYLCFGYLTKVPFCRKLISTKYLTSSEINWINEYHKSIREDFGNKLLEIGKKNAYNWLWKETKPL